MGSLILNSRFGVRIRVHISSNELIGVGSLTDRRCRENVELKKKSTKCKYFGNQKSTITICNFVLATNNINYSYSKLNKYINVNEYAMVVSMSMTTDALYVNVSMLCVYFFTWVSIEYAYTYLFELRNSCRAFIISNGASVNSLQPFRMCDTLNGF